MAVCTQSSFSPPPYSKGSGNAGGVSTQFIPSPIGLASAALLALTRNLTTLANLCVQQELEEISVQAKMGLAMKKVFELAGSAMQIQSEVEGGTAIGSGVMTLGAAAGAAKIGRSDVIQSQEELNGAKNYQNAFEETAPSDLVLNDSQQSPVQGEDEENNQGLEHNCDQQQVDTSPPEEDRVEARQQMSEEDIQQGIEALKKREKFVDEKGKAVEMSEEERDLIRLLKRENSGEFSGLKDSYAEKVKARKEGLERAQGSFANRLNTFTIGTNAGGSAINGVGQAGTGVLKKEQADLQGQETTGKTAMELTQSVMSQMGNNGAKCMNSVEQIDQEMVAISNANQLGA